MCLSTFLDFWISGAHEREITFGNLPLSEVLRQSINSDGYRRDVSEFRREPAMENHTPRVPEARWRIYTSGSKTTTTKSAFEHEKQRYKC